jgi:hypothetical protein
VSLNVLEEVKTIKERLDKGFDYKEEKKKFFQIVDFIKVNEIKNDDILDPVSEIRYKMASTWRPNQYSVRSGVSLWISLVILGCFFIAFTFIIPDIFSNLGIWKTVLNISSLIIGWLSINIGIHNLGHFIAGKLVGIHFNSWVIRSSVFQWALMIEYKSYLKASFRKRQILHISGPACTLGAPLIIYMVTLNPIMIGVGIYMIIGSIPVIVMKKWDYGRIFKERKLKQQNRRLKFQ